MKTDVLKTGSGGKYTFITGNHLTPGAPQLRPSIYHASIPTSPTTLDSHHHGRLLIPHLRPPRYAPIFPPLQPLTSCLPAQCIYSKRWHPLPSDRPDLTSHGVDPPLVNGKKSLSKEDDAKLIFGVVFSLRNISRRLGGDDNSFLCYRTGDYKLHYYETLTKLKFAMVTDIKTNSLQLILHQIWATLYVEYVVKNPLSPVEHTGGVGVANELFETALDKFVQATLV
jgi:trafficking protein particle complex subunit 1